ncbi:MAG: hypothetical protein QM642_06725 [Edaphocola sp.]
MENTKSNFQALVAKMETLTETEQGKLKGGVSTLSSAVSVASAGATNYVLCVNGICLTKPTTK